MESEALNSSLFINEINKIISQSLLYIGITGLIFSLISNTFNIAICLRQRIRNHMMGFYNVFISISNINTTIWGSLLFLSPLFENEDLSLKSNFSCVLINFMTRFCGQTSAWFHVFLTLDRYLCVSFNQELYFIFKDRKKLSLILLALTAFICGINVPNLFLQVSFDSDSKLQCMSSPTIYFIRNVLHSLFRVILPIILQIIFSSFLIYKLFKVRQNFNSNRDIKKDIKFARNILWLNLMFIITETPLMMTTIYFGAKGATPVYPVAFGSSHEIAVMNAVYFSTVALGSYLFWSIGLVNLFTNKLFKKEINTIVNTYFKRRT